MNMFFLKHELQHSTQYWHRTCICPVDSLYTVLFIASLMIIPYINNTEVCISNCVSFAMLSQNDWTYSHQIWYTWWTWGTVFWSLFWVQKVKGQGHVAQKCMCACLCL